jgi:hypothetical protein
MVRSMEGGGGGYEFVWAGQGMPGTNVPGQRGRGAYVERTPGSERDKPAQGIYREASACRVMGTRDIQVYTWLGKVCRVGVR